MTGALTVNVIVVLVAHWPAFGVNVDVKGPALAVLKLDGLHVPVIEFVEVVGSAGAAAP